MHNIGTAHVSVTPDTTTVETVMRVVGKHMMACADDLAAIRLGVESGLSASEVEATLLPFRKEAQA